MNVFKESAQIFQHYLGKPAHRLDETHDKMLVDINALLSATYRLGYIEGSDAVQKRIEEEVQRFVKEEHFQQEIKRVDLSSYFKKTEHIERKE